MGLVGSKLSVPAKAKNSISSYNEILDAEQRLLSTQMGKRASSQVFAVIQSLAEGCGYCPRFYKTTHILHDSGRSEPIDEYSQFVVEQMAKGQAYLRISDLSESS